MLSSLPSCGCQMNSTKCISSRRTWGMDGCSICKQLKWTLFAHCLRQNCECIIAGQYAPPLDKVLKPSKWIHLQCRICISFTSIIQIQSPIAQEKPINISKFTICLSISQNLRHDCESPVSHLVFSSWVAFLGRNSTPGKVIMNIATNKRVSISLFALSPISA